LGGRPPRCDRLPSAATTNVMTLPERRLESPPPTLPTAWPELMVRAVEAANWRVVHYEYRARFADAAQGRGAPLYLTVNAIARAQRWQALGQLPLASREIADAARMLPRATSPRPSPSGLGLIDLTPPPPRREGLSYWAWRAARVLWREQQEMLDLKVRLRHAEPAEVLRAALVERLRCVDKDPWTWGPIIRDDGINLLPSRKDLLDRATDLRQFARPPAGDVVPKTWQRAGGYGGLYANAMCWLAKEDLVPWAGINPLADGIPVRCGRRYARREARLWVRLTKVEC
jgi:hypothetical protein